MREELKDMGVSRSPVSLKPEATSIGGCWIGRGSGLLHAISNRKEVKTSRGAVGLFLFRLCCWEHGIWENERP